MKENNPKKFITALATASKFVLSAVVNNCKKRPLTELCAPLGIRIPIANSCMRCAVALKGSHRVRDERIFSKNLRALSLMTTSRINQLSARSISLDFFAAKIRRCLIIQARYKKKNSHSLISHLQYESRKENLLF
jgi:hypothetical protein